MKSSPQPKKPNLPVKPKLSESGVFHLVNKYKPPKGPPGPVQPKKTAQKESILDFFYKMRIRSKLSLIVGFSVIIVAVILISTTLQQQETELRKQTEILGTSMVQSLAAASKENLLLNSYPVIQDYIKELVKRRPIPALEAQYVFDRKGMIVAHLYADSINHNIAPEEFTLVQSTDTMLTRETRQSIQYILPIYQRIPDEQNPRIILLGGASVSFSKSALLAPIERIKRLVIATAVVVCLFGIAFMFLTSGKFVQVITSLSDAARRVGEGDLLVAVDTRFKDELGTLANEFNKMVQQLREKTEMQKFLSRSAVEMLSEEHTATLGGTRKTITVMFTDIRDFTGASETLSPEEVVETLNQYLDLQTRVIHTFNGVVDKFLGDGIMSIFSSDDMAFDAVSTACKIQEGIVLLNKERSRLKETTFSVGIGVAVGSTFLGSIGSRDRMDYTAIGDTVNLASRLCSVAGPNEILVTEEVAQRLDGRFQVKPQGNVSIKGKQSQVPVFQVVYSETKNEA